MIKWFIALLFMTNLAFASCAKDPVSFNAIDKTHYWLSRAVCWPAVTVDGLFLPEENAKVGIKTTESFYYTETDYLRDFSVSGYIRLPNLEERVKLVFKANRQTSETPAQKREVDSKFSAAFTWAARQRKNYNIDIDVGVNSDLTTHYDIKSSYIRKIHEYDFGISETIFWEEHKGIASDTVFSLGKPIYKNEYLNYAISFLTSEELNADDKGFRIASTASYIISISRRASINYYVTQFAYTRPTITASSYIIGARYRENFYRSWLFYEVEPYVAWERAYGFDDKAGIVFRLQAFFGS